MRATAERLLILGTGPLAGKLSQRLSPRHARYLLLGVVTESPTSASATLRHAVVGSMSELPRILESLRPDRILVASEDRGKSLPIQSLLDAKMDGIAVEKAERFYERISGQIAIESIEPGDLVLAPELRWPRLQLAVERALNMAVAAAALLLLAPVFALVACAILIDSDRPVFFVQPRVGLKGRPFRLLKFRTMRPAVGRTSEWVRDNGHRITRVGRWLRRFRLDELPQLINILRGEMNFVGPRPHPTSNFEMMSTVARNVADSGASVQYYALRSSILPGITGWAQVRFGYANDILQEIEKLRYDLYYVKHRSPGLDLRILAETFRAVLTDRGSSQAATSDPAPNAQTPFATQAR